nr:helix-turn-helix domain-containing protein [Brevibacillus aydinogluensis]
MSPEAAVQWMDALKGEITVKQACKWLGIARSSYYRWKNQRNTQPFANPIVTRH